jgi:hypothetical protein
MLIPCRLRGHQPTLLSGLRNGVQPLKIPESRLLFIYFADIRRGVAGRIDCCSRMADLQVFSPLREMER